MQPALFHQTTITHVQTQASRVLPGHGTGMEIEAVNDELYQDDNSPLRLTLLVMANVIGGTLLLSGMFYLPHLLAEVLR
jgi:hypothetical protein